MGKGGGGGSTPVLVDDNLKNKQFIRVIDLISEGEIEGPVNGLNSVLLNGTPVVNSHGETVIPGVDLVWKAGSQVQDALPGFAQVENEINVGLEVKHDTPLTRTVSNSDVDRLRLTLGVSALVAQNDKGDQRNSSVSLSILTNDGTGWAHQKTVVITGKISGQYLESHTVNAPAKKPFQVRVVRNNEDSVSDLIRNGTVWTSYTELTDARLTYPNSAVIGITIDRSQFSDNPKRTYHLRGKIVKIPENYDPYTRTYSGVWNGRFKLAWTNNPAWIYYDLVTDERYGLGKRVGRFGCDKWAMYAIGRYCDEMVDNGFGGKEPRFTCNVYLVDQRNAYDVLSDLASVFRGMPLWDGLMLTCVQDRPTDPVWTFTNSNVIDGKFSRKSAAMKSRHTVIHVSWSNPDNNWKEDVEYIANDNSINRYGLNVKKVVAFGCTSRGQAHRVGRWLLETERLETETNTFSTGAEGLNCMPGDIVEIVDNNYLDKRAGGRVLSVDGLRVKLDCEIEIKDLKGAYIAFVGTDGARTKVDIARQISADVIELKAEPAGLNEFGIFSIVEKVTLQQLYRVLVIDEDKDGKHTFTCLQHEPLKERVVDDDLSFETAPGNNVQSRIPAIDRLTVIPVEGSETAQARAMWAVATTTKALTFEVKVYRGGKIVSSYETNGFEYTFNGFETGNYLVGVRAKDKEGRLGDETKVAMIIGAPAPPSYIKVDPGYFSVMLTPQIAGPSTLSTEFEFWFSEIQIININNVENVASFQGIAKTWTQGGLKTGSTYYFYVRSINAYGISSFVECLASPSEDAAGLVDILGDAFLDSAAGEELKREIEGATTVAIEASNKLVFDHPGAQSATYSVKAGVNYNDKYIGAGMVIGVEVKNGAASSSIGFSADKFMIFNPANGKLEPAFAVKDGQVFIKDAFIGNATITSAKIADELRSSNYVAGKSGLRIGMRTGDFELNSTKTGGQLKIDGTGIRIYDSKGKLKIEMGLK